MNLQKIKRTLIVLFIPLILAGIATAHFLSKDVRSRYTDCIRVFEYHFLCKNNTYNFHIEHIYKKEKDKFEIYYTGNKDYWGSFIGGVDVDPVMIPSVIVTEADNLERKPFLKEIIGEKINLALTRNDKFHSGAYADGLAIKCLRITRELGSLYSDAWCLTDGVGSNLRIKFTDDSISKFNEIENSIVKEAKETYREFLLAYFLISISYFILIAIIILASILIKKMYLYVNNEK